MPLCCDIADGGRIHTHCTIWQHRASPRAALSLRSRRDGATVPCRSAGTQARRQQLQVTGHPGAHRSKRCLCKTRRADQPLSPVHLQARDWCAMSCLIAHRRPRPHWPPRLPSRTTATPHSASHVNIALCSLRWATCRATPVVKAETSTAPLFCRTSASKRP